MTEHRSFVVPVAALRSRRHRDVEVSAVRRRFPPDNLRRRQPRRGRKPRQIFRGNRKRHPPTRLAAIVFDEHHATTRLHTLRKARQHARLIVDEMQDVGEQHPVDEIGELERAGDVGDDAIDMRNASQRGERSRVVIDGIDVSLGSKSIEQRSSERPVSGADVRPRAAAVVDRAGDEVDRLVRVQATAGVSAGTFVRPRYARYNMMPLMITCGMLRSTFPMTSVP